MPSRCDVVLGEKIRTLREERNIGSRELSADLGHGPNYVSRVEGGYHALSLDMIARVAAELEVTPETLIKGVWDQ